MTRSDLFHGFPWVDSLLLLATLVVATWVVTRTVYELESALSLEPKQKVWDDLKGIHDRVPLLAGRRIKTLREQYAEAYPRSPLATMNQIPGVIAAWTICARIRERTPPFLAIASLGIGIVAIRRPGHPARRARWGPGRVAAAVSLVVSGADLLLEFVLRRFGLMHHGYIHYALSNFWEYNAEYVGMAILGAWSLLVLAGRWKLTRGWSEWLGLGLGVVWFANLFWAIVLQPLAQF